METHNSDVLCSSLTLYLHVAFTADFVLLAEFIWKAPLNHRYGISGLFL